MSKAWALERFPTERVQEDNHLARFKVILCRGCGATHRIRDTTRGGMPPEMAAKRFSAAGWSIGQTPAKDRCPTCAHGAPKPSEKPKEALMASSATTLPVAHASPASVKPQPPECPKRGDTCLIPDACSVACQADTSIPMRAEPPREATREDRRRIMEELDNHYDPSAGRYRGDYSDALLAEALNMPRRWITDMRVQFYGDEDRNEAAEVALRKNRALLDDLIGHSQRAFDLAMEAAGKAEEALNEAKRLRAKIEG